MAYFFCKLIPPRSTFPFDMTGAEKAAMDEHVAYWRAKAEEGVAITVGPVFDPKGAFGIAIAEAADAAAMGEVTEADPVIRAGLGFAFEVHPIPSLILRGAPATAGST
jgi:uncharacterized protein YciI